jgi:Ca-activated chloride channel family protein
LAEKMFRFASPEWLPGLFLVPVLLLVFWAGRMRRRRLLDRFGDSALVQRLTDSVSLAARRWKASLILLAIGLLVLAAARPQFGTRVETVRRRGQDVMVAVDLSRSMLAQDVTPSRLDRARLAVLRLIRALDGDRIGLVAFAGDAFVQSPLTVDYAAAALFLNAMDPEMMPVPGTDLGEALRMSLDALEQAGREDRLIVVVTDGEDHEGQVEAQTQRAAERGVRIHAVGIGSAEGVPIPESLGSGGSVSFKRDEAGNVVTTRLEEGILRGMAETTGGRYVRVTPGSTAFEDLMDEIAGGEGEELEAREITQFEEQYQLFLGVAIALLLAETLVPDRRKRAPEWSGRFE